MSKQAIKYQSTVIEAGKSAGEISDLVRRYGGSRFEQRWNERGELDGIRFALRTPDLGEVPVHLRAQTETIERLLRERTTLNAEKRRTQAQRIAWRQLKDFVEQALLAVETGLFPIGAAFTAHIEVWDDVQNETVPMAEFLHRRGRLEAGDRGLRLLPAAETARVIALPPARGA